MCAEESILWRLNQKKGGKLVPKDHVTVVYYFPTWGDTSHPDIPADRWHSCASVEESRILEFKQSISDIENVSVELYTRFMKGWVLAEGLQHWAWGVNLQKPKKKAKGHTTINPIHNKIGNYGIALAIPQNDWINAVKNLDHNDVIMMICCNKKLNRRLPKYDISRMQRVLEERQTKTNNAIHSKPTESVKDQGLDPSSTPQFSTRPKKNAANPVFNHQLFYVMDETCAPEKLTNGENGRKTQDNNRRLEYVVSTPNIQSDSSKSLRLLFHQYKDKCITAKSKNIFDDLAHLTENRDDIVASLPSIVHLLSTRIIELEKEVEK